MKCQTFYLLFNLFIQGGNAENMRHIITILFFLCPLYQVMAQKSFQIKYEIGISHTNYELTNPQNNVQILNNDNAYVGFSVSYKLRGNFHLESGFYSKYYGADFFSSTPDTTNLILALDRIQMPFRVIYKKSIFTDRFYFSLITGTSMLIGHSKDAVILTSDTHIESIDFNPKRNFGLFELGAGIEYEVLRNLTFGINMRSFFGVNQKIGLNHENLNSDNSLTSYHIRSNGTFQAYTFGVGYNFNGKKK